MYVYICVYVRACVCVGYMCVCVRMLTSMYIHRVMDTRTASCTSYNLGATQRYGNSWPLGSSEILTVAPYVDLSAE